MIFTGWCVWVASVRVGVAGNVAVGAPNVVVGASGERVAAGAVGPGAVSVAEGKAVAVGWAFVLLTTDICSVPQAMIKKVVIKM
jgi:hypothetical protein